MQAPYGDFIVCAEGNSEIVLIAGGTGITAYFSFMEDNLVKGCKYVIRLHYGCRENKLLIYSDIIDRCVSKLCGFHVRYYFEKGDGGDVITGEIELGNACQCLKSVHRAKFHLCGPKLMIEGFTKRLLIDYKVSITNIFSNKWQ